MNDILKEAHEKRTEKLTDLWACAHEYAFHDSEADSLRLALTSLINIIASREGFGYEFVKDMTALANSTIAERVVEQKKAS
jgi:hypothetical protein